MNDAIRQGRHDRQEQERARRPAALCDEATDPYRRALEQIAAALLEVELLEGNPAAGSAEARRGRAKAKAALLLAIAQAALIVAVDPRPGDRARVEAEALAFCRRRRGALRRISPATVAALVDRALREAGETLLRADLVPDEIRSADPGVP